MKKLIFASIALLITSHTLTYGQIVESSCEAPDSIVQKYQDDADALTLRKFYENDLPWADSIEIPDEHSDTVLNALLAVWNADELAARDTVVEMFDIHSRELYAVNYILVGADSTLAWMQELEAGNIPCGNDTVDSLINRYSLNLTNYYSHAWEDWPRFDGESNLNMGPLGRLFLPIYGVQYVDTLVNTVLDGDRIDFSINSEFVELTYSYGWGDCLNGCMYRRYWKFNVYYDCSVEYMGSYGNVLEDMSVFAQNKEAQIEIYPNPVKNRLKLKLHDYALRNEYQLEICSLSGQKLLSKDIYKSTSLDLSDYSPGIYLLIIKHNNKIIQEEKIIVE